MLHVLMQLNPHELVWLGLRLKNWVISCLYLIKKITPWKPWRENTSRKTWVTTKILMVGSCVTTTIFVIVGSCVEKLSSWNCSFSTATKKSHPFEVFLCWILLLFVVGVEVLIPKEMRYIHNDNGFHLHLLCGGENFSQTTMHQL